jgi:cytochrome c-type biogenesis protein CcsB
MQLVALQSLLDNISFAILFLTMLAYWVNLAFPSAGWLRQIGTAGMAIANLSIATLLGARWIDAGYFPLSNLYESLFFLAWGITTMHLVANSIGNAESNGRKLIGAFTAPVAMGITAFAALMLPDNMQVSAPLVPALKSNWLMMHVSVMLLSYAALMVGSVLAIAFLIVTRGQPIKLSGNSLGLSLTPISLNGQKEQRDLKPAHSNSHEATEKLVSASISGNGSQSKTLLLDPKAPPRSQPEAEQPQLSLKRLSLGETLDNLSYRMIGLGFPLLTIGIIAGAVWANEAWGSYWSWDPKETWALITWLVFAAYLHTRITKGWQGRKPAIVASMGFLVVWVCYLGVNLLGKGLHSYGWFL